MSQNIRSFIAIELPDGIKSVLENIQQELKSMRLRARWVKPKNIHLTLKFLGNVDPLDIDNIAGAIDDAAREFAPFTLKVGGIGFFPGIKRPRVVWVGLDGDSQILLDLQRNLEDHLAALGFQKEKRAFKAHLTLGRIRNAVHPDIAGRAIEPSTGPGEQQFTADRIILFKSDLKPTGAEYSKLKETRLLNEN
jgi:2'-5' RNA ligase